MEVLIVGAGAMGRWMAQTIGTGTGSEVYSSDTSTVDGDDPTDTSTVGGDDPADSSTAFDDAPTGTTVAFDDDSTTTVAFDDDSTGTTVAFTDVDPAAAETAAESHGGRSVPLDTDERFDLVCIAVPVSIAAESISEHAAKASRAIVDVSGTMAEPVEAMREHAPDRERLSLHPLFAPDNAPGTVAVVADAPGPVTDQVRERIEAAGNVLFETTPAAHDTAMETVQAKAHAAILAFALAADDVPEPFQTPVSSAIFDLAETVLDGTPRVYGDIQRTFAGADEVAAAARRIAETDDETFERLYVEASEQLARSTDRHGREPSNPASDDA